jgi:hypothetical protein
MQRHAIPLLIAFLALTVIRAAAGEGPAIIPSTLRSVIVYRSGAELTHTATARLEQGDNVLVIEDVSNTIDAASIRVGCSANVTIMSVTLSTDFLRPQAANPLIRKLQDSIAVIKKELTRLEVLTSADNEQLDLLNSNKNIGANGAGVNVTELAKLMDYHRQKMVGLKTELNDYHDRSQQLKELAANLDDQIKEEESKNTKTGGSIVLRLLSPLATTCDFTLTYLTTAAHWEPSYDLKVDHVTDPIHILYKAQLVQTSGIDWKHVKLSLSTSTPAVGGNAPVLKTWFLRFVDPAMQGLSGSSMLEGKVAGVSVMNNNAALDKVVVIGYASKFKDSEATEYTDPLYIVNGREISKAEFDKIDPRAFKKLDVLKGKQATDLYGARGGPGVFIVTLKDELSDYVSISDKQMDVVFDIDIPYDIPGNGKEEGVLLKEYQMPCNYQYYAAPRMDKDAFLLGQMPGWEKLNLLPGEANIMVEGTFIGKSYIDANSVQDTLNLTLGRDKRIVVKKEKVADYSSVKFLGSNKKETFTYEITVRNNKKEKILLLLKDQYPISSSKDIEEELLESSGATVNKDTGILTWDVELGPGESHKYRISYSIKYPKDKILNMN